MVTFRGNYPVHHRFECEYRRIHLPEQQRLLRGGLDTAAGGIMNVSPATIAANVAIVGGGLKNDASGTVQALL